MLIDARGCLCCYWSLTLLLHPFGDVFKRINRLACSFSLRTLSAMYRGSLIPALTSIYERVIPSLKGMLHGTELALFRVLRSKDKHVYSTPSLFTAYFPALAS